MPPGFSIADNPTEVDYEALSRLFMAAGWGNRGGARFLERAFRSSYVTLFVIQDTGDVLGCARALSDGVYYATIHDILVAPAWQRQGIGSQMLGKLLQRLSHIPTILAPALPQAVGFYRRCGFVEHGSTLARFLNPEKENLFKAAGE